MKRVVRLLVVLLPLALLAGTVPASANDEAGYLALGDSYAFGFNPLVVLAGGASNPANFPGYTDAVAGSLDLNLANAACPGETSGSMISGTRPDNGCQDFRTLFPLHVQYTGAQLAFAVSYLQSHRHTDLVTIQVGGNDVLSLQRICAGDAACIIRQLPGVEAQMAANLNVIYAAIRTGAHYRHTIVVVPYFAFNYNDPNMVAIARSLDSVVVTVGAHYGARPADVFGAFAAASAPFGGIPCLAGLQVRLPTGGCDIHPSAAGHALIAQAILAVLPREEDQD
jgi:lysophospholipase L1-like esterase